MEEAATARQREGVAQVVLLHGSLDIWVHDARNLPDKGVLYKKAGDILGPRIVASVADRVSSASMTSDPTSPSGLHGHRRPHLRRAHWRGPRVGAELRGARRPRGGGGQFAVRTTTSSAARSSALRPSPPSSSSAGTWSRASILCWIPMASRALPAQYCGSPYSTPRWLTSQRTTVVSLLSRTAMGAKCILSSAPWHEGDPLPGCTCAGGLSPRYPA
ncbi:hypothetical protein ZWY2020_058109 [Hordeum vulgare]|nr:hypothetical protein ZWY2020_058109 [Hordeum vulgare]